MQPEPPKLRKYPRHRAPSRMFVAWKSAGQRTVSRAAVVGMGGLFLHTPNPPSTGSLIELIFDLKGGEVRAHASVRDSRPGDGMGVQFVKMQPADRARLNQFLAQYAPETQAVPDGTADHIPYKSPKAPSDTYGAGAQTPSTSQAAASQKRPAAKSPAEQFSRDLAEMIELAANGTYYQLLGVASESELKVIKRNFYAFAQKFHPDHHMLTADRAEPLKQLMATVTEAYKTLSDKRKRAMYDAQLAASSAYSLNRDKTAAQKALEEFSLRAAELLRAKNFVGSVVWLRKCVELVPNDAKYHALLGRSLGTIPRYRTEAIQHFERAIELDPWNVAVYAHLAELHEEMGEPQQARPLYATILKIDPNHRAARKKLTELDAPSEN